MCIYPVVALGIISDIEDSLGLRIPRLSHNGCLGAGCPPRGCRNAVLLSGEKLSHFTTARAAYITPQHTWESVCSCNGTSVCVCVCVCVCLSCRGINDLSVYLMKVHKHERKLPSL